MRFSQFTVFENLCAIIIAFLGFQSNLKLIRESIINVSFILAIQKYSDWPGGLGISKELSKLLSENSSPIFWIVLGQIHTLFRS